MRVAGTQQGNTHLSNAQFQYPYVKSPSSNTRTSKTHVTVQNNMPMETRFWLLQAWVNDKLSVAPI